MAKTWLQTLCERAETFERRRYTALRDERRGAGTAPSLAGLYEKFPDLTSRATYERLLEARESADDEHGRDDLGKLLEHVADHVERRAAAPARERLRALESAATVDVNGETLPLRAVPALLRSTADAGRRAALDRALAEARGAFSKLLAEAQDRARDAAAELGGFEDYPSWRATLSGFDLEELVAVADRLLDETDDMCRDATRWLLRGRVDLASRPMAAHDLAFASRAVDLDPLLALGELWRVADFLERLGLEAPASGRIRREPGPALAASAPACCVPLRVPQEVLLFLPGEGGLPAWRGLLHETGRALLAAARPAAASFPRRRLVDRSFALGWAALLDHLLLNPVWARRVLRAPAPQVEALTRAAGAVALIATRRVAAGLRQELAHHRGQPEVDDLFVEGMRRATGAEPPRALRRFDVTFGLRRAHALRGALLEAAAHAQLRERYDEDWFLNPRAGAHLGRMLSRRRIPPLEELARRELDVELDPSLVVRRFEEVLS